MPLAGPIAVLLGLWSSNVEVLGEILHYAHGEMGAELGASWAGASLIYTHVGMTGVHWSVALKYWGEFKVLFLLSFSFCIAEQL